MDKWAIWADCGFGEEPLILTKYIPIHILMPKNPPIRNKGFHYVVKNSITIQKFHGSVT